MDPNEDYLNPMGPPQVKATKTKGKNDHLKLASDWRSQGEEDSDSSGSAGGMSMRLACHVARVQ